MRTNGGLVGPQNLGNTGVWSIDDQARGGVILPTTEAAAAAALDPTKTFVCEMTASSGSETGVGALAGADLVLTPFGSPGPASGGFHSLNGSSGYNMTQAALAALLNGDEWTIMLALRNMGTTAQVGLMMMSGATSIIDLFSGIAYCPVPQFSLSQNMPTCVDTLTGEGRLAMWRKGGNVHYGYKSGTTWPTGWDSLPTTARQVGLGGGKNAGAWSTNQKIAGFSSGGLAFDIGTIVISKIGLQAAPV